jgi:hypothetical protein
LTEVGFLASATGDTQRAEAIFGALERVRPAGAYCYVGLALACLNAGRADDAVGALDRGLLRVAPDDRESLQAFRGLALQLAGRSSESMRALAQASHTALAKAMLGQGTMQKEGN